MSKTIKGTKTEQNLLKSFAGESQARNRYTFFASIAKKEGFVQISNIFAKTAEQEKEHAKRFFKFLEGGDLEITATYPAGKLASTLENLKAAAAGENEEWEDIYPEFAKTAKEEGFDDIAAAYNAISIAEKQHAKQYTDLAKNIENDKVFKKDNEVIWVCQNCGYIHSGKEANKMCPACLHPQAHFEILNENY